MIRKPVAEHFRESCSCCWNSIETRSNVTLRAHPLTVALSLLQSNYRGEPRKDIRRS